MRRVGRLGGSRGVGRSTRKGRARHGPAAPGVRCAAAAAALPCLPRRCLLPLPPPAASTVQPLCSLCRCSPLLAAAAHTRDFSLPHAAAAHLEVLWLVLELVGLQGLGLCSRRGRRRRRWHKMRREGFCKGPPQACASPRDRLEPTAPSAPAAPTAGRRPRRSPSSSLPPSPAALAPKGSPLLVSAACTSSMRACREGRQCGGMGRWRYQGDGRVQHAAPSKASRAQTGRWMRRWAAVAGQARASLQKGCRPAPSPLQLACRSSALDPRHSMSREAAMGSAPLMSGTRRSMSSLLSHSRRLARSNISTASTLV